MHMHILLSSTDNSNRETQVAELRPQAVMCPCLMAQCSRFVHAPVPFIDHFTSFLWTPIHSPAASEGTQKQMLSPVPH